VRGLCHRPCKAQEEVSGLRELNPAIKSMIRKEDAGFASIFDMEQD
jgi:hypothetical protein